MPHPFSQALPRATLVRSDPTATLAQDLKALGINVAQCHACQGRWFAMSCRMEALNRFLAPRFFSVMALVVVVFTAMAVWA